MAILHACPAKIGGWVAIATPLPPRVHLFTCLPGRLPNCSCNRSREFSTLSNIEERAATPKIRTGWGWGWGASPGLSTGVVLFSGSPYKFQCPSARWPPRPQIPRSCQRRTLFASRIRRSASRTSSTTSTYSTVCPAMRSPAEMGFKENCNPTVSGSIDQTEPKGVPCEGARTCMLLKRKYSFSAAKEL